MRFNAFHRKEFTVHWWHFTQLMGIELSTLGIGMTLRVIGFGIGIGHL